MGEDVLKKYKIHFWDKYLYGMAYLYHIFTIYFEAQS